MTQQLTKEERTEAQGELRRILKGQDTIRTLAVWTGSTAYVRLFIVKNNKLIDITGQAGVAMGEKTTHAPSKPYGFKRGGYGYGKEFDVVFSLGRTLYPKGYKHTKKECHSNDHVNGWDGVSKHHEGGYRFRKETI